MRLFLWNEIHAMRHLDIFGNEIHEYLFVIEPDEQTTEALIHLRKQLNTLIPLSDQTLESKPHISLCYFEANDFSDELIISKAKQRLIHIENFNITVDGCEKWNNGTFILKVKQDPHIETLLQELATVFKGIIRTPHLTIARGIPKTFLEHLPINDFQYRGNFNCTRIVLLKKTGDKAYQVLHKFSLQKVL